uniref:TBC1 domain family member 16 (Trinotate prediction) n=1 Tax=Henneguya salminicola TaxID=69463 RepID=A0A6G3MFK7_HENSL
MLTNIELTIDKDVNRTDRNNPFYSGYQNKNLKTLKNILLNYCYSRPHIGYTQGMTDLLAPLLQVLNSESEAFWCFIEFVENNYCAIFPNNENMDHVTKTLRELIHFLLPDIYLLISSHDCDVLLIFTHRWFLLCFQREFESEDVFKIWEACWSNQYCSLGYFQFFVALSILFCYHEINEMGTSIFSSSTDEALIFFSQNAFYDCDAILKCSQILLKAFRKSDKIPCSLRCFLDYKIGGGWEISSKSQIECTCLKHRNSCIYKSVSISENMNILVSRASCRIDIESIRTDYHQSSQEEDNRVFEK